MPKARTAAKPKPTTVVPNDTALQNLQKIDHIVILMMENRSFDHMLGFLTMDEGRTDLEGPHAGLSNSVKGKSYPIHAATSTKLLPAMDPDHSAAGVAEQVAGGAMSGFAANYAATRPTPPAKGDTPAIVMAYHTAKQLPVYDYLAAQFCVCDHWFCSVPGATMPNRCYAVAGTSGGRLDALSPPRPYDVPSVCRQLDKAKVSWRWYSHDYVPTLWIIDPEYGLSSETVPAYFDRKDLFGHSSFLDRAAAGNLPAVSWIDPNFVDLSFGPAGSNDDHPPSDLHAGQKLVLELFDAVVQSPNWGKTMVIVTYDEHGGFYDHVPPPACADDSPKLRKLGPRVPAFVISPWVEPGQVEPTVFDHTSIVKTILARFCRKADGTVPDMGARVRAAAHLGGLLGRTSPRPAIPRAAYQQLITQAAGWGATLAKLDLPPAKPKAKAKGKKGAAKAKAQPQQPVLTDFQDEFLAMRQIVLDERAAEQAKTTGKT